MLLTRARGDHFTPLYSFVSPKPRAVLFTHKHARTELEGFAADKTVHLRRVSPRETKHNRPLCFAMQWKEDIRASRGFIAGRLRPTQTYPNDSTSGRGDERGGVAMGEIKEQ